VTVIEIGCGTGLVTARYVLAGFDVIGLDPSELMLQVVFGEIETWTEVEDVSNGVVTVHHCGFATTLLDAGFVTEHRYGGWDQRPFTGQNDEIVAVASVPPCPYLLNDHRSPRTPAEFRPSVVRCRPRRCDGCPNRS